MIIYVWLGSHILIFFLESYLKLFSNAKVVPQNKIKYLLVMIVQRQLLVDEISIHLKNSLKQWVWRGIVLLMLTMQNFQLTFMFWDLYLPNNSIIKEACYLARRKASQNFPKRCGQKHVELKIQFELKLVENLRYSERGGCNHVLVLLLRSSYSFFWQESYYSYSPIYWL